MLNQSSANTKGKFKNLAFTKEPQKRNALFQKSKKILFGLPQAIQKAVHMQKKDR